MARKSKPGMIENIEIVPHRNGDAGCSYHAVKFNWRPPGRGEPHRRLIAFVFDQPRAVAVSDVDLLARNDIGQVRNVWHAEAFEDQLRRAISDYYGKGI